MPSVYPTNTFKALNGTVEANSKELVNYCECLGHFWDLCYVVGLVLFSAEYVLY